MTRPSLHEEFNRLETRLHELIILCSQLRLENQSLKDQQGTLVEERANLIKKNEMARSKVEQMITRLKSMEAAQ
ncbi:MAG: TIGR02449 family protein [Granulosicoccus sp.]|nr:TIGR02449 family protein [Granulosicoccus sp.]